MIYGFLGVLVGMLTSVINEAIDADALSALTSEIWEDYPKMWIAYSYLYYLFGSFPSICIGNIYNA